MGTTLTVLPVGSGLNFEFPVPQWTYSIPTLVSSYSHQGISYSFTYYQGVDYLVSGYNCVYWLDAPPAADPRYPSTMARANLYAANVYVINPVLMNTWAVFCGFNINSFSYYNTYGQPYYTHLKMLIWALVYKQLQVPSIKNLSDAFAISLGMPFAYTAGTVSSYYNGSNYVVTIGNYIYTLPPGMLPTTSTTVNQFDVIAQGVNLYDYNTNPALVNVYANVYNSRNTLVFGIQSTASIQYDPVFQDTYMTNLMPKQVQWYQSGPYAWNSLDVFFNDTELFMNEN